MKGGYTRHGLVLVAACVVTSACSNTKDAGNPITDAGADAAQTGTMTILVVAPSYDLSTAPPAANAQIAVDLPGGIHRELTVGADGRSTLTGIDWSLGTATVIAFGLPGRRVEGVTDVGPDTFATIPKPRAVAAPADVVLSLMPLSLPNAVAVSGNISKKKDPADWVLLSGTRCVDIHDDDTTSYSLTCASGDAFRLVGRDELVTVSGSAETLVGSWFAVDVPAKSSGPAQIDLDLSAATQLPVSAKANVHVATPAGASASLNNPTAWVWVTSTESDMAMYLGSMTSRTPTSSGFDVSVEWVALAGQSPITISVLTTANGTSTQLFQRGLPTDGATIGGFLLPPTVTGALALQGPIPIVGAAPDAVVRIDVYDHAGSFVLHLVAPPGTSTMHPPSVLPAGAKPVAGTVLFGGIDFLAAYDPATARYFTEAFSREVKATLP